MADSSIEWTDKVWNPVSGCTRASAGCDNCYAVMQSHRIAHMAWARHDQATFEKYEGLTVLNDRGKRHFNGVVRCHEDALSIPLRWRKPRRIFVNSMSDLFHRDVPWMFINRVFGIMACCPQHTFQILTKRPDIMADYLNSDRGYFVGQTIADDLSHEFGIEWHGDNRWPLSNVHLGTSVEDQQAADERIPHLLRCPAAFRFLSLEPLIGPVELNQRRFDLPLISTRVRDPNGDAIVASGEGHSIKDADRTFQRGLRGGGIDLLIIGGESGPNARPCDLAWIRSLITQGEAAGVPVMLKQLGRRPENTDPAIRCGGIKDSKGGKPEEWPADLRPYHEWPLKEQTV